MPKRAPLTYISPLPWDSFAQRPHHFVEWFHSRTGAPVLWIEPYPTRLPRLSDLRRPAPAPSLGSRSRPWLTTLRPRPLPIEPLPYVSAINNVAWTSVARTIAAFAGDTAPLVVVAKPSAMAVGVLRAFPEWPSLFDLMDDFPAFYSGLSRAAMRRHQAALLAAARHVLCSSTALLEHARRLSPDARLVTNALDPASLPPGMPVPRPGGDRRPVTLGYVGTIGAWFDWDLVIGLAAARPQDCVRLVGPLFAPPPSALPKNVEILPPVPHDQAIGAMAGLDVCLIPFKDNALTASVDPIKYYEYRALGKPILTTSFGEMRARIGQDGVFDLGASDLGRSVSEAVRYVADPASTSLFIGDNSWERRFDDSVLDILEREHIRTGRNTERSDPGR